MKAVRIVLPLVFALVLVGGLLAWSRVSLADLAATVRSISPACAAGILASTALFILLSALKWRLVMGHIASDEADAPSWGFSLYYTGLGSVLALVITPHAAMVVSRSFGTKIHLRGSPIVSAAASAYEQLFDVVPLVTMSVAALSAILLETNLGGWLAIAAGLNAAALLAMIFLFRTGASSLARLMPLPHRSRESLRKKLEWFETPAARTLLGPSFVSTLFAISLARYAVILLRTGFVMAAVALPISTFQFFKAYGLARLSTLLSITPGELGISEWTWTGVLTWMGCRLDEATRFGLTNRVYNIASLVIIFALLWVTLTVLRIGPVSGDDRWRVLKRAFGAGKRVTN